MRSPSGTPEWTYYTSDLTTNILNNWNLSMKVIHKLGCFLSKRIMTYSSENIFKDNLNYINMESRLKELENIFTKCILYFKCKITTREKAEWVKLILFIITNKYGFYWWLYTPYEQVLRCEKVSKLAHNCQRLLYYVRCKM